MGDSRGGSLRLLADNSVWSVTLAPSEGRRLELRFSGSLPLWTGLLAEVATPDTLYLGRIIEPASGQAALDVDHVIDRLAVDRIRTRWQEA